MDFGALLTGEINKKKAIIQSTKKAKTEKKYVKTADLLETHFEHQAKEREEKINKRQEKLEKKRKLREFKDDKVEYSSSEEEVDEFLESKKQKLSEDLIQAKAKLRELNQPIRLYGETDQDVIERSKTIQEVELKREDPDIEPVAEDREQVNEKLTEPAAEQVKEQNNEQPTKPATEQVNEPPLEPAAEKVKEQNNEQPTEPATEEVKEQVLEQATEPQTVVVSQADKEPNKEEEDKSYIIKKTDVIDDLKKVSEQCRDYIKDLSNQWETQIQTMDPEKQKEQQLKQQQLDLELLTETKRWLLPLLLHLKRFTLPSDQLITLSSILIDLQEKEFIQAGSDYIKLSIGNIAWPIGVISVGIHSRSAHSKLEGGGDVSNIMKDEKTRRWILAIKRLITFCESNES
ncbi:hypothetical protein CANARDRAFT_29967 [[Candida] arabinofermentans NRRL YB-2248]|uniref:Pre-mRNA-splicing factor 18 n=1 Tax=[Candida] arabinofermentans NRRL YB-2248 TaxID=983967 RepID=A0A1E4SVL3_9ASCO|nr:hypothetical protein CANARDRAFT_29967 [[Candida] arabinofermentans NRRL YB-2248]